MSALSTDCAALLAQKGDPWLLGLLQSTDSRLDPGLLLCARSSHCSWESLRRLLQLVTNIPEDILPKLHVCTTHRHTETPGPHSPLLSPTWLSGSWAGLLRQLPSLSTEDSRSQALCRELAFWVPNFLGRGHRWHRTSLFLSDILRRMHNGLCSPNLVTEFASATKGVWSPVYPKLSICFHSPGPRWRRHQTLSFCAWQEGRWGGRGVWLASRPPPSVSPLGDKVGGASEKNPRAISTLLGSRPQPAGNLVTGEWGLISSLVRLAWQTGPHHLDSWAHLARRGVSQRVEPESHPQPSWCSGLSVSLSSRRKRGRKKDEQDISSPFSLTDLPWGLESSFPLQALWATFDSISVPPRQLRGGLLWHLSHHLLDALQFLFAVKLALPLACLHGVVFGRQRSLWVLR